MEGREETTIGEKLAPSAWPLRAPIIYWHSQWALRLQEIEKKIKEREREGGRGRSVQAKMANCAAIGASSSSAAVVDCTVGACLFILQSLSLSFLHSGWGANHGGRRCQ